VIAGVCPSVIATWPNSTVVDTTEARGGTTTTVLESVSPSLEAVIVAVPELIPVTTPVAETSATFGSLLVQAITRSESVSPAPSDVTTFIGYASPTPMVSAFGTSSATDATATDTTRTNVVSMTLPLIRTTAVFPTAVADTRPVESTRAIDGFVDDHVMRAPLVRLTFTGSMSPRNDNRAVRPTARSTELAAMCEGFPRTSISVVSITFA